MELISALTKQFPHALDHLPRFAVEAMAGHPGHLDAGQLQALLAQAVALEGLVRAMGLVGVEFGGEAVIGPVDVELVARLGEAGDWSGQARLGNELQEAALET
jgi:hypothetical protein